MEKRSLVAALIALPLLASAASGDDRHRPGSNGHVSSENQAHHSHHHQDGGHQVGGMSDGHAHSFEIGAAPGLVFVPHEGELALGLHLHVVATIGESRWGAGGGVERLFDEHGHTTVSALLQFRLLDPWTLIVAPGITFSDVDPGALQPSVHVETAYEFMFGHFHIGPSFEFAVDPNETHVTLGVHTGVGF